MTRIDHSARMSLFTVGLVTAMVAVPYLLLRSGVVDSPLIATLASGIACCVPALWLVHRFARRLKSSVSEISDAFCEVEHGVLAPKPATEPVDEFADLLNRFNRLVEQLASEREEQNNAHEKAKVTAKALVTSGRLAAVGQLAAGVAHEINNPLTYVRANLGQLREHWQTVQKVLETLPASNDVALMDEEGEQLIDESLEGVERAVAIVRDIKGFAHSGFDRHADVELNALLDSVLRVSSAQMGAGVTIEKDYASTICVPGSEQELKQVFLNLVVNAAQAVGERGTIRIETREEKGCAVVTVHDDGIGIDETIIDRLFDPFFTTKPVGTGTGLGLSISHEIIQRHRGEIRVRSGDRDGTCFSVVLPTGD